MILVQWLLVWILAGSFARRAWHAQNGKVLGWDLLLLRFAFLEVFTCRQFVSNLIWNEVLLSGQIRLVSFGWLVVFCIGGWMPPNRSL